MHVAADRHLPATDSGPLPDRIDIHKVVRTIADLDGADGIVPSHISEVHPPAAWPTVNCRTLDRRLGSDRRALGCPVGNRISLRDLSKSEDQIARRLSGIPVGSDS